MSHQAVLSKVLAFFEANPSETLDAEAISIKFGCSRGSVHTILAPAIKDGRLDRDEDLGSGELIYKLVAKAKAKPLPSGKPRFWMDATAIRIDKDVPLLDARSKVNWTHALDRMEVNDSFAVGLDARCSLGCALMAYKRATGKVFVRRTIAGEFRVWRVK